MDAKKGFPTVSFQSQKDWEKWLSKNFKTDGIWLRFFKKASGTKSVNHAEALEAALCYGWIDGMADKYDNESWLQKFTPRRKKSSWSKVNTEHAERLIKEGKMKPSGLKAIEEAKEDGRWHRAYDSPKNNVIPEDFMKELRKNKKAEKFFLTLNKANLYSIGYRLQTAKKPETRKKRMTAILEMLAEGKKFH